LNDYLLAIILGVVEGITEFLPISSTAHLRIAQHFLGLSLEDEYWKLFAIFIQLGAILAVVAFYRRRLTALAGSAMGKLGSPLELLRHPVGLVGIAFVATVIPVFLLKKVVGENLENLSLIASVMVIGGVVMIVVDAVFGQKGKTDTLERMKPWQALAIGLIQILSAVFPGTSRSMSTIAGGQVVGLSRAAALEFSFLLSVPVMAAATLYDLLKYVKESGAPMTGHQAGVLAVGFVVSFFVAYAAIAWFLAFVARRGFFFFGLYRIAFGVLVFFLV
jgi:undecaprenyl-diphosphatase